MLHTFFLLLVLTLGALPARAADAPAVALPATPLGEAAAQLVEIINSGDAERQRRFIHERLSKAALAETPAEEYLAQFQKIAARTGGIDVVEVRRPDDPIILHVKARKIGRWAELLTSFDEDEPGRLRGVGMAVIADPTAAPAWPEGKVGEREIAAAVEAYAARAAAADDFSGVVLVARGDRILVHKGYGYADRNHMVANRPETKFHLGSMNKMFTSVLVAQLVEAGKLSFDDTLAKVLPEYPNREAAAKITIRHLLTHTAGLGGLFDRTGYDRRKKYQTHAEFFPIFAGEPLYFEPGSKSRYSNEGFLVLGAVVEKVTGRSYYDLVRERVYAPAGMTETESYRLDETVPNLAVGYGYFDDDPMGLDARRPNHHFLGWRGNACGGGYSTAADMLKFAVALETHKLLGREMTELVTSRQGLMRNYGMGFQSREIGGKSVRGHSGGGANSGINSDLEMFWDGSYTVAVMGNYDAPAAQDLARGILEFLAKQ